MIDDVYGLSQDSYDRVMAGVGRARTLPPRREGQLDSRPVHDSPANWIKATATTTSTINLSGGGTLNGYTAVWSLFDSGAGTWTDNDAVWFYPANGETPTLNSRYLCRCIGQDTNGQTIWSTDFPTGGGGSGFALHDHADASIDAACTVLRLDADQVITASNTSTGHDTLSVSDASTTQRGAVNLTTQTWSGDKITRGIFDSADGAGNFMQIANAGNIGNSSITGATLFGKSGNTTRSIGFLFDTPNLRAVLGSDGGAAIVYSVLDASNIAHDGKTGTSQSGDTITGGIVTALATDGATGTVTYIKTVNFGAQTTTTGTITITNGRITAFT